jgi:Zn-dependent alcohol dehydrogenase
MENRSVVEREETGPDAGKLLDVPDLDTSQVVAPERVDPERRAQHRRRLIDLIWSGEIDPGKVFDLTLPLDDVAEGYRAMDERRAIKTLLAL